MDEAMKTQLPTRRETWRKIRVPLVIAGVLGLIYLIELAVVGSTTYGAAYRLNTGLHDEYGAFVGLLSPFLHSNHDHITWNLVTFLLLSILVLSHENQQSFLLVFLIAGWFTAGVAPLLIGGGLGFGISGANAALGGWESIYRIRDLLRTSKGAQQLISAEVARAGILYVLTSTFVLLMLGQGFGWVDVPSGVSVLGHFGGALFGIAFGLFDPYRDWFGNRRGYEDRST